MNRREEGGPVIGCDVGGTFTDFFVRSDGQTLVFKVPSTPAAPQLAVLNGLARAGAGGARLVHGSTIATNALLQRRGAKTALFTTGGFRDVIEIGRQARPRIYELEPRRPPPLVPRELRFEVPERVLADGSVEQALNAEDARRVAGQVIEAGAESVAICLLFSFLRPEHEALLAGATRDLGLYVSASHEVLPEYREYERTATTAVNAYVGPLMARYLEQMESAARGEGVEGLEVMNSAGGIISVSEAGRVAAQTVLSGPAGGVAGAFYAAAAAGERRIISFDMGGTSTDVALCDGEVSIQTESVVAGTPVRLPAVDVHTVGAGGGSIAWLDAAGSLQVGPQSAGADPGPAAYGRGTQPTVTDAHVVLGHLPGLLADEIRLDRQAALKALGTLGAFRSPEEAARAILRVARATMERALRVVSLERGHDPRDFALVPFGGAGPLHACALADALGIRRILVPAHPGVLSAVGMSMAPRRWEYSAAMLLPLSDAIDGRLRAVAGLLEERARAAVGERRWLADLRFRGQAYDLRARLPGLTAAEAVAALREAHERRYGFVPSGEPEIVNLRLVVEGRVGALPSPPGAARGERPAGTAIAFAGDEPGRMPWLARDDLRPGESLRGPAIVTQYDCTTLVGPDWTAAQDEQGNLRLERR